VRLRPRRRDVKGTGARAGGGNTFAAMAVRNYRLYFVGQIISMSGTWMQSVAQIWLVYELTHNGVWLGLITAAQFVPMMLFGPYGGTIADRVDKRRLLVFTQTASGSLALILGLLTATHSVQLWMVFALAIGLGTVNTIDNPTRQAFVIEMVGPELITNAVTLNSVVINGARIVGPAVGGILIATVGVAVCFLYNAASFAGVIVALMLMRRSELQPAQRLARGKGQIVQGLRYVWREPVLRTPLLLVAVIGTLAYNFTVTLSLMATRTFHAGSAGFGTMTSMMGAGAVVGGLVTAGRSKPTGKRLVVVSLALGVSLMAVAVMPTYWIELVALLFMGGASIAFIATANTTLQLGSAPEMRGRVMALYAVAFLGTTPIGGPLVGWIAQTFGPRAGVGVGGVAALVAAMAAWPSLTHARLPWRRSRGAELVLSVPKPEETVSAL
jgi:MFS family permease